MLLTQTTLALLWTKMNRSCRLRTPISRIRIIAKIHMIAMWGRLLYHHLKLWSILLRSSHWWDLHCFVISWFIPDENSRTRLWYSLRFICIGWCSATATGTSALSLTMMDNGNWIEEDIFYTWLMWYWCTHMGKNSIWDLRCRKKSILIQWWID